MSRRPLFVFSPFAPQRNGLADYIAEYVPLLAQDYALHLVAQSRHAAEVAAHHAGRAGVKVIDEATFLAMQPGREAQTFYNIGNNDDCAYLLDYVHAYPGAQLIHDISLFYLHQVASSQSHTHPMMGQWLAQSGYHLPDDFMGRDGAVTRTPGLVYQECLLLQPLVRAAQGVMVHTRYAELRLRGGAPEVALGAAAGRPFVRIPHFILKPPLHLTHAQIDSVLRRFQVEPDDFLLLVPGFLTGNKMLYEVLAAFRELTRRHPQRRLKLLFGGQERASEYPVSERARMLWPYGDGPQVTGYLSADELDVLLGRADVSFVLRYPTYGESSGILPRAAMGGGRVVTVDIGAYPEFVSPQVSAVSVGQRSVPGLIDAVEAALAAHNPDPVARAARAQVEAERNAALAPEGLYPALRQWLDQTWEAAQ